MGDIKCHIEECFFNDNGGAKCLADAIEVRSSVSDRKCDMSENTCCETFKSR
ncbi:MAG: DUF1540 domain-containing protein [Candidatus Saccharibacteria bacterium]